MRTVEMNRLQSNVCLIFMRKTTNLKIILRLILKPRFIIFAPMKFSGAATGRGTQSELSTHLTAAFVALVWGSTFVSTKVLLNAGLGAFEIFFYRFLISYAAIWFISPQRLWADSPADELLMVAVGLTGGSVYFLSENIAVDLSTASNVSLIVCANPLITMLLVWLSGRGEKPSRRQAVGSAVAFAGMALVVLNGQFVLRLSPLGDMLALVAAVSWAFYTIVMKRLTVKYPVPFITRKVFFYGLVTLLPIWFTGRVGFHPGLLKGPAVWGNLLFLGFVASLVCYVAWNRVIRRLGSVRSSAYVYLIPLATIVTAVIVLRERITGLAVLGTVLILGGLYLNEKKPG